MGYPSLLYQSAPGLKPMNLSVFEDLQLLNFIPRAVAKAVRVPCEPSNILARQALFRSLRRQEARERFAGLYAIAEELLTLAGVFSSSRCDAERHAVFLSLMRVERQFAGEAAQAGFGDPLSDGFAAAFAEETAGKLYRAMTADLEALSPEFDGILRIAFRIHGQEIRSGLDDSPAFVDRIGKCAEQLGLDRPRIRETEVRRLSPDLLVAAAGHHPDFFKKLAAFYERYRGLYSESVTYYAKELRFYLTMLAFFDRIGEAGIPLTFPTPVEGRGISVTDAYDVSLLAKNETKIVPNDIDFTEAEPFYYLTGANGGGKTTYLRTVGIAAVLYLNGCPVPCRSASFGRISSVFTHFPRDERFDGSGRFVEEDGRVKKILGAMDGDSLVLLNETYSATNEENAIAMTEKLAEELYRKKIFGLYITHQHSLSESEIPYLNVLIDRSDMNRRTFKIAKEKSTGGSFAGDILRRYGLTPEALEERFGAPDNG